MFLHACPATENSSKPGPQLFTDRLLLFAFLLCLEIVRKTGTARCSFLSGGVSFFTILRCSCLKTSTVFDLTNQEIAMSCYETTIDSQTIDIIGSSSSKNIFRDSSQGFEVVYSTFCFLHTAKETRSEELHPRDRKRNFNGVQIEYSQSQKSCVSGPWG